MWGIAGHGLVGVAIARTACPYAGTRPRFNCRRCARRVAVLYLCRGYFACRHCQRVAYSSQSDDALDRMWRRQSKIEARLGENWQRPKGTRQHTCERLVDLKVRRGMMRLRWWLRGCLDWRGWDRTVMKAAEAVITLIGRLPESAISGRPGIFPKADGHSDGEPGDFHPARRTPQSKSSKTGTINEANRKLLSGSARPFPVGPSWPQGLRERARGHGAADSPGT